MIDLLQYESSESNYLLQIRIGRYERKNPERKNLSVLQEENVELVN